MLTFTEFFIKKKIDLTLLQKAEPALFAEFKSDFEQMGAKSFDHSKKFWFNKLRRTYHTKEEPKPAKTKVEITEIAFQAEPLSSPSIEQKPTFAPRFKSTTPQPATPEESVTEITSQPEVANIKPAFKPRFKPGITKLADPTEEKIEDRPIAAPKPTGFKPRFNAAKVKLELDEQPQVTKEVSTPEEAKPAAYKPKFNIKNLKTEREPAESKPQPLVDPADPTEKPAYKPKFNMKNIKPKE